MSYRSDVRIITSKKGFNKLKKFTDNYLKEKNWQYDNLLDNRKLIAENNFSEYFGWDSIKWYDYCEGYEDVTAIIEGLKYLEENDMSYRFARIGESYDDYEEHSYESNIENEQDLTFPYMLREFDDDYVIDDMNYYNKNNDEIDM